MATDVYVMPLWRFIAGDFSTPLETNFGATTLIVQDGHAVPRARVSSIGWFRRLRAKRHARRLIRCAEKEQGARLCWNDEGEVAYSNQFRSADVILQYLWWHERQDLFPAAYESVVSSNFDPRAFWQTAPHRAQNHPHLQSNNYYDGLLLPVDFPNPGLIDKEVNFSGIEVGRPICSSIAAMRELNPIIDFLKLPENYTEDWKTIDPHCPDEMIGVKMSFDHLRTILRASTERGLPAIFWG